MNAEGRSGSVFQLFLNGKCRMVTGNRDQREGSSGDTLLLDS